MSYLDELNESQRDAVLYVDGPSLVIAGAGSGKTRVLVSKITYLLDEKKFQPWSILALTFTNKAAREMKERIALQVGDDVANRIWAGTFHSIFSRILRKDAERIGFNSNFTIYDTSDQKSILKAIIKELQLDEKKYKPGSVLASISNAKNRLVTPDEYSSNRAYQEADRVAGMPRLATIYQIYWDRLKLANSMDFDDLLFYTYLLFSENEDIRQRYSELFRFVLVDEYQDTNYAQHQIVLQLTKERSNVCVVGDDAQSIYSFRGANIDNILNFQQTYKGAKLFKLEQNYRSTKTIVNAANSLIKNNLNQIQKDVFSQNEEGDKITVIKSEADKIEGENVARRIKDIHTTHSVSYDGFAVLYRTNSQSRIFEEVLRKYAIPYRIYGGQSFYQRKEIKDIIAYFRLIVNPNDDEALKRIINYPTRGIGNTTISKLVQAAVGNSISIWDVICSPLEYVEISKGTHAKLQTFRQLIEGFIECNKNLDAYNMAVEVIKKSGVMNDLASDKSPEGLARKENVEELGNAIHAFVESRSGLEDGNVPLVDFLSEVSLLTDADEQDDNDMPKVTLMTVHSAKGLEFNTVFVVGMEDGLFPSQMSMGSPREVEEERRLFYVAITRAEKRCFLTYSTNRFRYGKTEFPTPSRFLKDIDPQYLKGFGNGGITTSSVSSPVTPIKRNFEISNATQSNKIRPLRSLLSSRSSSSVNNSSASATLKAGDVILHERFGRGTVVCVDGSGMNEKATVDFEMAGQKQLLLKYARYQKINE